MSTTHASPSSSLARIHFSWLLQLRWVAFAGQLVTILVVVLMLGVSLPLPRMLPILLSFAASNVLFELWFRREGRISGTALSEHVAGTIMVGDLMILTALLSLSGGNGNPFCAFYVVNVTLAAVLLRPSWAWSVAALAAAGFTLLHFAHVPLPANEVGDRLVVHGLFVAAVLTLATTVYFVTRVTRELAQSEAELRRQRELRVRGERLQGLATLAAGAAHELGSPLSTIAVVAKELERSLADSGSEEDIDDARLIREEVSRCRRILDRMDGAGSGEDPVERTVADLLEETRGELPEARRVDLLTEPSAAGLSVRLPGQNLIMALRGLVQNALDASPPDERVSLQARRSGDALVVSIVDHGSGMDEEARTHAADPFFTTKEPGAGMGLGMFLANSVIERLQGTLFIDSTPSAGTTVRVEVPLGSLGARTGDE
ncbi:MAG: HAMP domain-containing sensor histidine kinase [Planctomycetota bacterium]